MTMVSMHAKAQHSGDWAKAGDTVSLVVKVYRDYMDSIAQAHPEVKINHSTSRYCLR